MTPAKRLTPFANEHALYQQLGLSSDKCLVALDEVGRGCVAGPVIVCATVWGVAPAGSLVPAWLGQVRDSKKLSSQKRASCAGLLLQDLEVFRGTQDPLPCESLVALHPDGLYKPDFAPVFEDPAPDTAFKAGEWSLVCLGAHLGMGHIAEIERWHIGHAVHLAASRALLGLQEQVLAPLPMALQRLVVLVDGNRPFCLPPVFAQQPQVTAVKGDDKFVTIGLSSIVAKVYRDSLMESHHRDYPQFGFDKHKGYGTPAHLQHIRAHGPSPLHRLSFLSGTL